MTSNSHPLSRMPYREHVRIANRRIGTYIAIVTADIMPWVSRDILESKQKSWQLREKDDEEFQGKDAPLMYQGAPLERQ